MEAQKPIQNPVQSPFEQVLQMGFKPDGKKQDRKDDQGCFLQDFLCQLADHLAPEEVIDLSRVNRVCNRFLSMRTAALGKHPILNSEFLSPREKVFYQGQEAFASNEIRSEQRKASRAMRRFLPLHHQAPFMKERQVLRDRYRKIRADLAKINVGMAFLEINSYLTRQEKLSEKNRLRDNFKALRLQSIQIEQEVSSLLDQLMDGREPKLEIHSPFFRRR